MTDGLLLGHDAEMRPFRLPCLAAFVLVSSLFSVSPGASEDLEVVEVLLEEAVPDSGVYRLSVRLLNRNSATASRFAFTVRTDGVEVPVYADSIFLDEIREGTTAEIQLFNLTSPGELQLELREAWWVAIVESDGERIQRPVEPIAGLPLHAEIGLSTTTEESP